MASPKPEETISLTDSLQNLIPNKQSFEHVINLESENKMGIFEHVLLTTFEKPLNAAEIIQEQTFMQNQSEFLQQIRHQIGNRKLHESIDSLPPLESSFSNVSSIFNGGNFFENDDSEFKTKFAEEFQRSLVASALDEIQSNCSKETFNTIETYVLTSKQKQFETVVLNLQKVNRQNEELRSTLLIKSNELVHSHGKLSELQQKFDHIEEEKRKIKFRHDKVLQKQKLITKAELSLIFKEKICLQGKKRYEREKAFFADIQRRLNILYDQMYSLWSKICNLMEGSDKLGCLTANCQSTIGQKGECWKKQVMKKCKKQLMEQRSLLKQEEEELEKQFEVLQSLSGTISQLVKSTQSRHEINMNISPVSILSANLSSNMEESDSSLVL